MGLRKAGLNKTKQKNHKLWAPSLSPLSFLTALFSGPLRLRKRRPETKDERKGKINRRGKRMGKEETIRWVSRGALLCDSWALLLAAKRGPRKPSIK